MGSYPFHISSVVVSDAKASKSLEILGDKVNLEQNSEWAEISV
jgi:hypothetical protein